MRTIFFIVCLVGFLLMSTGVFAESPWMEAISGYKPMYLITGIGDDQGKINISFKFDVFHSLKIGLYFAYNQLMFWQIYEWSSPFTVINFAPEIFWCFESGNNFAGDMVIPGIDYIQLGFWDHLSNGQFEPYSLGFERSYVEAQFSVGSWLNLGINLKFYYLWRKEPNNEDYEDYMGNFAAKIFLKLVDDEKNDLEELYASFGIGNNSLGFGGDPLESFDPFYGWQEIGMKTRVLFSRFRPYIQFYSGYGECINTYNVKNYNSAYEKEFSIRIGLIFE
ncbi:MAG: phospholipase A [Spirochaetales bacterium]|nr:phospholipase A [Spirochaetales bacterium]